MESHSVPGQTAHGPLPVDAGRARVGPIDRAVALATRAAKRPLGSTFAILAADLILIALFIPIGELVFNDPAELFRELMPGTLLSVAQLLFVAAIALAI